MPRRSIRWSSTPPASALPVNISRFGPVKLLKSTLWQFLSSPGQRFWILTSGKVIPTFSTSTPPGAYYVAVRYLSDAARNNLAVRDIRISRSPQAEESIPDAVTALAVASTSDPDLTVSLRFRLPEKRIDGTHP